MAVFVHENHPEIILEYINFILLSSSILRAEYRLPTGERAGMGTGMGHDYHVQRNDIDRATAAVTAVFGVLMNLQVLTFFLCVC